MRNRFYLLLIVGLIFFSPVYCDAQNYSGQWLGTVTKSINHCRSLGKAEIGEYKLTIIQKNDDITVMENVVQRPYKGVIHPDRPEKVHVQGAYVDDGGYVSEFVDITFDNAHQGQGQAVWTWSDGYFECGGRYMFDLKKIRD